MLSHSLTDSLTYLGPFDLNLVDWDNPVDKLLVFQTEMSETRMRIFLYEHSITVIVMKLFPFETERPKENNLPPMYIYFRNMHIILVTKVTGVDKARTAVNDTTLLCQFLVQNALFCKLMGCFLLTS